MHNTYGSLHTDSLRLVSGVRRSQGRRHSLPFCCHSNGEIPPRLSCPANSRANFLGLRRARSTLSGGPRQPLYSKSDITAPGLQWQVPQTDTALIIHRRVPIRELFRSSAMKLLQTTSATPVEWRWRETCGVTGLPRFLTSAVDPAVSRLPGRPAFAHRRLLLPGALSLADILSSQPVHHWHPP